MSVENPAIAEASKCRWCHSSGRCLKCDEGDVLAKLASERSDALTMLSAERALMDDVRKLLAAVKDKLQEVGEMEQLAGRLSSHRQTRDLIQHIVGVMG